MKLTTQQLKKIIKEELGNIITEKEPTDERVVPQGKVSDVFSKEGWMAFLKDPTGSAREAEAAKRWALRATPEQIKAEIAKRENGMKNFADHIWVETLTAALAEKGG